MTTAVIACVAVLACILSCNGPVSAQMPPMPRELYCGRRETYNPMEEICCRGIVRQLVGPPQFGQCCMGEVIDNRTETCCMGREKAARDQACCGYESYDLMNGESCCGNRYIYEPALDMCCNGYLAPHTGHICCKKGPVAVKGIPGAAACCGCGAISTDSHVCCDGVPVKIGSGVESCCGGTAVHNPSTSVCCNVKGKLQVVEGRSCQSSLAPAAPKTGIRRPGYPAAPGAIVG